MVDEERFGDAGVRLVATARINTARVGLGPETASTDLVEYLQEQVGLGLRARLTNASLLTGGLKIELVMLEDVAPALLEAEADPFPLIPTVSPDVADVTATAQGVLQRVSDLPIEELLDGAVAFLDEATTLIASEDLQAAPEELRAILASVRSVTESDGVQGLPDQTAALLAEIQEVSARAEAILQEIEEAESVVRLTGAIDALAVAAGTLPGLAEEAGAVLAKAEALALEDLVEQASRLLRSAGEFVGQDSTRALPATAEAALNELSAAIASVRGLTEGPDLQALPTDLRALVAEAQGAAGQVGSLLTELEANNVAGEVVAAIADVRAAAETLPALAEQASGILAQAEDLPLQDLATRTTELVTAAEALINQDTTRALPEQLNGALSALRASLEELRDGGLVTNANETLVSARAAAEAIAEASRTLPDLSARLQGIANQIGGTASAYSSESEFNRDLRSAMRQVEAAAASVDRLARTLERNPNSLIIGR